MPDKSEQHCRAAPVLCVHLLVAQSEHLLHGGYSSASKAFVVLAHLDGFQPLGYRPEHGAVTATGAGQADGDTGGEDTTELELLITYSFRNAGRMQ